MKIITPLDKTNLSAVSWLAGVMLMLSIMLFVSIIDNIVQFKSWLVLGVVTVMFLWLSKQTYDIHMAIFNELHKIKSHNKRK
jgi:hypothetical protein